MSLQVTDTDTTSTSEESYSDNDAEALQLKLHQKDSPIFYGNIEVSDSAEVHFGNTSVYNGPVTVQNIVNNNNNQIIANNGEKTTPSIEDQYHGTQLDFVTNEQMTSSNACYKQIIHNKKLFIAMIMILLLCTTTVVIILLSFTNVDNNDYFDEHESVINGSLGSAPYYKRTDWLAQPPTDVDYFKIKPINLVIISHTVTEECFNKSQCIRQVKMIQYVDIRTSYLTDIQYNFLIGGDGGIYQGRGWNITGELTKTDDYDNISISIGVIGKFKYTLPNQKQLKALKIFLNDSVRLNKLSSNYSLIAHRQVSKIYYPGLVFYNELKTWPHWSNTPNQPQEYIGSAPYYSREFWLLRKIKEISEFREPPLQYVIISDTTRECVNNTQCIYESRECLNFKACTNELRYIQQMHIEEKEWGDIAYNFLIGGDGGIYEGRGWNTIGAHSRTFNNISIGISVIGNFMYKLPEKKQMIALKLLIEEGVRLNKISTGYKLLGHCQVLTSQKSPGKTFYDELKTWEHWSPNVL